MKKCGKCGESKPFSEFPKVRKTDNPLSPSSYRPRCKVCYAADKREARVAARAANPSMRPYNPIHMDPISGQQVKRCTRCGATKPTSEFEMSGGHIRGMCRMCDREYDRELYWRDPDKQRRRAKEWAANNTEKKSQRLKSWRVQNRAQLLVYHRAHNAQRREAQSAYDRQRRANMSPEKRAAIRQQVRQYQADLQQMRRAQKRATRVGFIRRRDIIARDGSNCYLCGKTLAPGEVTIDHVVPLSKGGTHTMDNLKIACMTCNCRKNNLPLDVYLQRFG